MGQAPVTCAVVYTSEGGHCAFVLQQRLPASSLSLEVGSCTGSSVGILNDLGVHLLLLLRNDSRLRWQEPKGEAGFPTISSLDLV
jgi:hypothetical protein